MKIKYFLSLYCLTISVLSGCSTHKMMYTVRWIDDEGIPIETDFIGEIDNKKLYEECIDNFKNGFIQFSNYQNSLNSSKIYLELYGNDRKSALILEIGLLSSLFLYINDRTVSEVPYKFKQDYIRMGYLREYRNLIQQYMSISHTHSFYTAVDRIIATGFWRPEMLKEYIEILYKATQFDSQIPQILIDINPYWERLEYLAEKDLNWTEETGFLEIMGEYR